jgi:hypothetical protein
LAADLTGVIPPRRHSATGTDFVPPGVGFFGHFRAAERPELLFRSRIILAIRARQRRRADAETEHEKQRIVSC